jgi:hypothetical protein
MRISHTVHAIALALTAAMHAAHAQPAPLPPRDPAAPAANPERALTADDRDRLFLLGGIAWSREPFMLDAELGWMFAGRVGVSASVGGAGTLMDGGAGLVGVGVRLWQGPLFVDGRYARAHYTSGCEFDDPCVEHSARAWIFGGGGEIVRSRYFGLELRVRGLAAQGQVHLFAGFGVGLYL